MDLSNTIHNKISFFIFSPTLSRKSNFSGNIITDGGENPQLVFSPTASNFILQAPIGNKITTELYIIVAVIIYLERRTTVTFRISVITIPFHLTNAKDNSLHNGHLPKRSFNDLDTSIIISVENRSINSGFTSKGEL